jgi:hypothetical protein
MAEQKSLAKLIPWVYLIITIWGIGLFFTADDWARWLGLVMLVSGAITTVGLFRKGRQVPPA